MKSLAVLLILFASFSLSGCAKQFNTTRDWLASPATTQAANNLKDFSDFIACRIAEGAAFTVEIEREIGSKQATIDKAGRVYTISAFVCRKLGGYPIPATYEISAVK